MYSKWGWDCVGCRCAAFLVGRRDVVRLVGEASGREGGRRRHSGPTFLMQVGDVGAAVSATVCMGLFVFSNEFCLMVFVLDKWAWTLMDFGL